MESVSIPTTKLPLNALTPHPENYNSHSDGQIKELAESLTTFGQFKNIVVWTCSENITLENGLQLHEGLTYILAGHGLWQAAMEAGLDELEVKDYSGLSYEMALTLLMTDNAAPLGSEPIPEKLAALMSKTRQLVADRPGLSAMLAKLKERAGLGAGVNGQGNGAGPEPGPLVNKAEELQKKWQVQKGQIWKVDRHFIICGDCRELETWKRLLAAAGIDKVNGVFTSPPYAEQRKQQYQGVSVDQYIEWWQAVQQNVKDNLYADGSFFVNIKPHCEESERSLYIFDLVLAMRRHWGWLFIDELCWRNTKNGVPGTWPNRFKNAFEPVYHFSIGKAIKFKPEQAGQKSGSVFDYHPLNADSRTGTPFTGAYKHLGYHEGVALPSNVLEIPAEGAGVHSAPFPIQLPEFFIKAFSDSGDSWIDPFLGSGTVIAACHNEGRQGLGIEQLEKYVSVTLERLAGLTNQQPELINSV